MALLGYGLWQRQFGGEPGALGKTLKLDGVSYTVVGVMPQGFAFPEYAEVWTPLGLTPGGGTVTCIAWTSWPGSARA